MRRRHYVPLRRLHDIPIRCEDVPLTRLRDVPLRRRWVFHLRRTCDVAGTYKETSLRRRQDVLLPGRLLRESYISSEKWFPIYQIFYSFGGIIGIIPCYNCRRLCLQISPSIIFVTEQNNVWLVYIFGIFFFDWKFITAIWSNSEVSQLHVKIRKRGKMC